jgi:hypothetical protein
MRFHSAVSLILRNDLFLWFTIRFFGFSQTSW